MSKTISTALVAAATSTVAATIQDAVNSGAVVRPDTAANLATEAVQKAVATPVVQDAIAAVLPQPIAWWKSQSLLGILAAAFGFITFAASNAPQIATLFPDYAQQIIFWGGAITTVIGLYNGASGRVTTTRPIAGTAAADKVASAGQ
jgi:hypothetical protein